MRQRPSVTKRALVALALSSATGLLAFGAGPAHARPSASVPADPQAAPPRSAEQRPRAYMVELEAPPAAVAGTTARRRGGSVAQAARQSRQQRSDNAAAQARVMRSADARNLVDRELYRVTTAYNGVAVLADRSAVRDLRALDGVRDVVPLPEHRRSNAASVPAVGAPDVWFPPHGLTGAGIRVGVIDSGVDYVHRAFGGSASLADLAHALDPASNPHRPGGPSTTDAAFTVTRPGGGQLYPSPRVTGGFDFAGDDYDAGSSQAATATSRPDPNPMDCPFTDGGGHGTHVAATLGGDGVASGGGPLDWQATWPPALAPLVGTGVAPQASIYSLRAFGCVGTSNLIPLAIDWALDPNRDGSTADRLDVLNLSLGSDFGSADDPTAVAVQNAIAHGVVVVVSAGNGGDQVYQVGSPATVPGAIAVANMVTGNHRDAIEVTDASDDSANGMHDATFAVDFDWDALDAPISGPLRRPTTNRDGCGTFANGSVAGTVALLDWPSGDADACGSAVRVTNARAAGAIGVVMATDAPTIDLAIGGTAAIPAAYVAAPTRAALLAALADGTPTVHFDAANVAYRYDTSAAGTVNVSSSRGPAGGGGLKPDLSAPGTDIRSAKSGTGDRAATLSGTSMAAPHVAGAMAILRQKRPTWTAEELKAAVVNTADPDLHLSGGSTGPRHTPARVGSGTLDVVAAAETEVVAFAAEADGAVGVSFGALRLPLGAPFRVKRAIEIVNRGATTATYDVAFDDRGAVPGVVWELSADNVTVPAGERRTIRLTLKVDDPAQLRNARDATLAPPGEAWPRRWLAEPTGLVRLTASGRPSLSVAAHASVRPAAATTATARDVSLGATATSGTIDVTGAAYATGPTRGDFQSRRTQLELQAESPRRSFAAGQSALSRADIRHVGVGSAAGWVTFGLSTWGPMPAPASFTDVEIDIDNDRDGRRDYVIYNGRDGESDVFVSCVWRPVPGGSGVTTVCADAPSTRDAPEGGTFDSETLTLSVPLEDVGITGRFDYRVRTWVTGQDDPIDVVEGLTWSPVAPGLRFATDEPVPDVPGPVTFAFDRTAYAANRSLGALLLHHLGTSERTSEAIRVSAAAPPVVDPPVTVPPVVDPPILTPPTILGPLPPVAPITPTVPAKRCRVPKLTGRSLSSARKQLRRANCRIGTVTRPRARIVRGRKVKLRPLVVRHQSIKPGKFRKSGTKVALRLREKPRR